VYDTDIFSTSEDIGVKKTDIVTKKLASQSNFIHPCLFITKFEKARVIGLRALQISKGSHIFVKLEGETDPLQIAVKEYKQKKIPFVIRRFLPKGGYLNYL